MGFPSTFYAKTRYCYACFMATQNIVIAAEKRLFCCEKPQKIEKNFVKNSIKI